jgi:hypothetical protein
MSGAEQNALTKSRRALKASLPAGASHSLFQRARDERRKAGEAAKSFTSDKLDILDAMALDPRLTPTDFRVAYWLIQHVNAETGQCNPSQRLIAQYCNLKERTVRAAIGHLCNAGWLRKSRSGRGSNQYRFSDSNVSAMLDRRTLIRDHLQLERAYRQADAGPVALDRHEDAAHDRQRDAAKHLRRTPESV